MRRHGGPVTVPGHARPAADTSRRIRGFRELIVPLDPSAKRLLDMLAAAGGMSDIAATTPQQMRGKGFRRLGAVDPRACRSARSRTASCRGPAGRCPTASTLRNNPPRRAVAGAGILPWRRLRLRRYRHPRWTLPHAGGGKRLRRGLGRLPAGARAQVSGGGRGQLRGDAVGGGSCSRARERAGRIAVGGDSAGAGLAVVVCQMAAARHGPHIALQLLFCPVLDMRADTPSPAGLRRRLFPQPGHHRLDAATLLPGRCRSR